MNPSQVNPSRRSFCVGAALGYLALRHGNDLSAEPPETRGHFSAVQFSGDGKLVLLGGSSGSLRLFDVTRKEWSPQKFQNPDQVQGASSQVTAVHFLPDGRSAVSGAMDSTIRFWDLTTGKQTRTITTTGGYSSVSISEDGKNLLCGESELYLRETATGKVRRRFSSGPVDACALSKDGALALSADSFIAPNRGGSVRLWDTATGKLLQTFSAFDGNRTDVIAFSPSADSALCVAKTVTILEIPSGKVIRTIKPMDPFFRFEWVSFTPTGRFVVTGGMGSPPCLWEVASGQVALKLGKASCGKIAVSPDGKYAIGIQRHEVVLWDLANGQLLWKGS